MSRWLDVVLRLFRRHQTHNQQENSLQFKYSELDKKTTIKTNKNSRRGKQIVRVTGPQYIRTPTTPTHLQNTTERKEKNRQSPSLVSLLVLLTFPCTWAPVGRELVYLVIVFRGRPLQRFELFCNVRSVAVTNCNGNRALYYTS